MAIEYKVVERANPQDRQSKKYYASANITGETSTKELCKDIEQMSTVNGADVQAVLYALSEVLPRHLADGKSVRLGELGNFRITIRSQGEAAEKDVDAHSITDARIAFTPNREFSAITKNLHYKKIK